MASPSSHILHSSQSPLLPNSQAPPTMSLPFIFADPTNSALWDLAG
jgi:hypothetical protein